MLEEWIIIIKKIENSKDNLQGMDLSYAKLMKANLQNADLSEADLSFAYLMRADLTEANLSGADLTSSVISEGVLKHANLEDAELDEAYLHGADLSGALNLTPDQIESAFIDRETKVPDYIEINWTSETGFTCRVKAD
ncbi:MAG: pentapeptide repeat-containing protein [Nitrospinales bacterium]